MKKIILLLFVVSAISTVGQTYHPLLGDTTEWNIGLNVFSVSHQRSFHILDGDHRAFGDTIISGLNYKFFEQEFSPQIGFIREDTTTQKVWFREDGSSPELLMYDFSLIQGDSVLLTFPNYISGDPYPSGWYFTDSVITRIVSAGPRKFYYLSNPASPINVWDNGNRFYLVWIEGTGSNLHPAYIYIEEYGSAQPGNFSIGCPAFLHLALVCSHKDGVEQYFDTCFWNQFQMFALDSCHYSFPGGLSEQQSSSSLMLLPNPATDEITIYNLEVAISLIEIYNVIGERIYKSELQKPKIDISNLLPGIYFVKLTTDKTSLTGKFVKE